ncbi:hypothetical protein AXG93_2891s1250 [Marchantia polymorpha subsp. ruderalis]|uniref:Uncharacterized protein n=1 Tax=Marchantia polymorpha subsp. ruderalis TaxID=1480154 RepID=A0A176WN98_MARPO|nr:hypothetical protein AXG93_2891s1250 [Marchantia polymorpha subsp. ruderalis]
MDKDSQSAPRSAPSYQPYRTMPYITCTWHKKLRILRWPNEWQQVTVRSESGRVPNPDLIQNWNVGFSRLHFLGTKFEQLKKTLASISVYMNECGSLLKSTGRDGWMDGGTF